MKSVYKIVGLIIFLSIHCPLLSQTDSVKKEFTYDQYFEIVKKYHPVVQQAKLFKKRGEAGLLNAKGSFDPKVNLDFDQKQFDKKEYFSLLNSGLKVPTWVGLDLKAAYEYNQGVFVNDENRLPPAGLFIGGFSLPIGQGLFIDERRAAVKQAQLYVTATSFEQKIILNELLFDAGKAYWDWFLAYNNKLVYQNALEIAQQRFEAVKRSAILGDRPFVDSLEAGIQVQDRMLNLQQADLEFKNKSLYLSTFLWFENTVPLEISENTIPPKYNFIFLEDKASLNSINRLDSFLSVHPSLLLYQNKIDRLNVDRKWKQEKLKPILNLNYNALVVPTGQDWLANYSSNNYKWGASFQMPLLLRKERGDLQMTKLKIQDATLELSNKNLEIFNKIKSYINDLETTNRQVKLYSKTVVDYQALLNAEKRMFDSGESSLFMINAREISAMNANIKLIDLIAKNKKSLLSVDYALGILGN